MPLLILIPVIIGIGNQHLITAEIGGAVKLLFGGIGNQRPVCTVQVGFELRDLCLDLGGVTQSGQVGAVGGKQRVDLGFGAVPAVLDNLIDPRVDILLVLFGKGKPLLLIQNQRRRNLAQPLQYPIGIILRIGGIIGGNVT